jgi:hypothetical protein
MEHHGLRSGRRRDGDRQPQPAGDNGYKVYLGTGAQIVPPRTSRSPTGSTSSTRATSSCRPRTTR